MLRILPRIASLLPALFATVATAQSFTVVLPAAASLHGLPPAFFRSDVAIFNRSAGRTALIRATYRCTTGTCDSNPRVFAIAPRQLYLLEDIAAGLFNAPETSGAIELSSTEPVVVTSRLSTPAASGTTVGMLVPGLGPEAAFSASELLNLSHSADPSVGFRTNLGVFNPTDQTRRAFIRCVDERGNLGFFSQDIPPHRLFQINDGDLFREFSLLRNAPSFYCSVQGAFDSPLFAWATVIDNRSGDPSFVVGQRFFPPRRILTFPAAASLHGAAGTDFKTDLVIFNDDVTGIARITALYRCFLGLCADSSRAFIPGGMAFYSDAVTTLFGVPESAGSIELLLDGRVNATSRLYTPARDGGTVGTTVPVAEPQTGTASQVLPLFVRGARVNVGFFNPDGWPQVVTVRLFSHTGELLGTTTRFLPARRGTQINDVFRELGVASDRDIAYCLVQGLPAPFRIYSYAVIIDEESQDPMYVPGQDDPESPPIE